MASRRGRTDGERDGISKISGSYISRCCDGVLFSTPEGTKTTARQTMSFLSVKLKVPPFFK